MSGSKTRPGFSGGDEPPPSTPEEAPSGRAALTMIGHEIHLRVPAHPLPAASVPPKPRGEVLADVPETVTDETTEELPARPSHSGKSKFPAFARLFGRWTTGGGFLSRSRMLGPDDGLPSVPREAWVSRLAIFVVAALFSFLVALAVLKAHRCNTSTSQPSAAMLAPPALPAPPAASAAPAVQPAPSAPSDPLAAASPPAATASVAPVAKPLAVRPQTTHRPARRAGGSSARAAAHTTGKLRIRSTRPDPLTPTAGDGRNDTLLPLRM